MVLLIIWRAFREGPQQALGSSTRSGQAGTPSDASDAYSSHCVPAETMLAGTTRIRRRTGRRTCGCLQAALEGSLYIALCTTSTLHHVELFIMKNWTLASHCSTNHKSPRIDAMTCPPHSTYLRSPSSLRLRSSLHYCYETCSSKDSALYSTALSAASTEPIYTICVYGYTSCVYGLRCWIPRSLHLRLHRQDLVRLPPIMVRSSLWYLARTLSRCKSCNRCQRLWRSGTAVCRCFAACRCFASLLLRMRCATLTMHRCADSVIRFERPTAAHLAVNSHLCMHAPPL
jgi:hypothetical protein